jgi:hypothetical protein
VSGDSATPLAAAELERLLRDPRRPAPRRGIAVSAASLAALARQPGLVDRLAARYCFTGEDRARGEPILGFQAKRLLLALTLDYETWHPLPAGVRSTGSATCSSRRSASLPSRRALAHA